MSHDTKTARILLLDEQELRCAGLACLLANWAKDNRLEVTASTNPTRLARMEYCPDFAMVIFSTGRPLNRKGDELNRQFDLLRSRTADARHVIITDRDDNQAVMAAITARVHGFIPTSMKPELAIEALSFILHGGTFFPPAAVLPENKAKPAPQNDPLSVFRQPAAQVTSPTDPTPQAARPAVAALSGNCIPGDGHLTARQSEVLELLCQGEPNKVIARALDMTEATVKVHVRQIMLKLGVTNRTQVAIRVMQENLSAMQNAYRTPKPADDIAKPEKPCANPNPRLAHLKS